MSLDVWLTSVKLTEVFGANITHNLNEMAEEAGIYKHVWSPEELGIKEAHDLIEPLTKALKDMKSRPEHYKKFNPENGWGSYDDFISWTERYVTACKENPESKIGISK